MVDSLLFTPDPDANHLLAAEPPAVMTGMLLDQQVRMEWAFRAPALLKERLGGRLDAHAIAAMPVEDLEGLFRQACVAPVPGFDGEAHPRPGVHLVEHYDGRADRLWADVTTGAELLQRVRALPGFGDAKAADLRGTSRQATRCPSSGLGHRGGRLALDRRRRQLRTCPRDPGTEACSEGCEAGWSCEAGWCEAAKQGGESGDDAPTSRRPATTQSMRMPAEMKVPKPRS